jgi:NitT/TauT family transport system ATP-binding protein
MLTRDAAADETGRTRSGDGPLLAMRGVGKTFANGTVALENMSLSIAEGDFLSLLGPSGCGKSTALRLISGLSQPTAGRIEWAGGPPGAGDIGFVFQEPTLMPWATVFDNVWLPLRLKGRSKREVRDEVMNALERVHLEDFAGSYPRELSGGMKMRVSIARALVVRPRILLMDEPFAALDEITRFKLNDDVLELWSEFGLTVVFVTHSVFESVFLSDRIVIMAAKPGRVFAEMRIDEPYPRSEAFRTSDTYAALCRQVSARLHEAMWGVEALA